MGGLPKQGAWRVCRFKGGGGWQERGGGVFEGGVPQCTLWETFLKSQELTQVDSKTSYTFTMKVLYNHLHKSQKRKLNFSLKILKILKLLMLLSIQEWSYNLFSLILHKLFFSLLILSILVLYFHKCWW